MMSDKIGVLVIGAFGVRICFGFRASDFEFTGQAEIKKHKPA